VLIRSPHIPKRKSASRRRQIGRVNSSPSDVTGHAITDERNDFVPRRPEQLLRRGRLTNLAMSVEETVSEVAR
jgi:hypothetical protein